MTTRSRVGKADRRRLPPAAAASDSVAWSPQRPPDPADLWRAYELAQRHYEIDLQLFTTRMNLFLLIQSALVAVTGATSKAVTGATVFTVNHSALAVFGLALAVAWFVAAISSYAWIKTWRAHMIELSDDLTKRAHVPVSHTHFDHKKRYGAYERGYGEEVLWKRLEWLTWKIRPTSIICCLPLLFIGGWIYLGWFV
jgi:hypothetical protein